LLDVQCKHTGSASACRLHWLQVALQQSESFAACSRANHLLHAKITCGMLAGGNPHASPCCRTLHQAPMALVLGPNNMPTTATGRRSCQQTVTTCQIDCTVNCRVCSCTGGRVHNSIFTCQRAKPIATHQGHPAWHRPYPLAARHGQQLLRVCCHQSYTCHCC
jgi:hypothetical protein